MIPLQLPLDVLIVDDDPLMLEAVAIMVEALGCAVATVPDGRAALDAAQHRRFDVIITDWQMPELDGIELARNLRTLQGERHLHIIMMTTRTGERTAREGLDVEVDDFLFKPVDPDQLALGIASARRSINLQRRLARRNRHLAAAMERARAAYHHIRRDLDAAAATQRNLLPAMQAEGVVRHAWLFIPSHGVGGDALDIRLLPDGQRFFFQIDVSGHGIPAALRSFALHHRLSARPPRDVATMEAMVAALNRDAQDEAEGAYYTMVCGLISPDGGRIDLIRAGHPMPLQMSVAGIRCVEEGHLPMGLLPGLQYRVTTVTLAPGERVVIHSDGLTDCRNRKGEEFGDARVAASLGISQSLPVVDAMAVLEADLRCFRGRRDFDDDVSVLVIEREHGGRA